MRVRALVTTALTVALAAGLSACGTEPVRDNTKPRLADMAAMGFKSPRAVSVANNDGWTSSNPEGRGQYQGTFGKCWAFLSYGDLTKGDGNSTARWYYVDQQNRAYRITSSVDLKQVPALANC